MESVKAIVQYKLPLKENSRNLYSVSTGGAGLWEGRGLLEGRGLRSEACSVGGEGLARGARPLQQEYRESWITLKFMFEARLRTQACHPSY